MYLFGCFQLILIILTTFMKILQILYTIWFYLSFVLLVLLFAPFIFLCLLLPVRARYQCMQGIVRMMSYSWFLVCGILPKVYNKHLFVKNSGSVIISNHLSYLDAPTFYTAIPSYFKSLGKSEIGKVPIFGALYKTVVVSVNRSSMADRVKSFRAMQSELEQNISIAIFPEGTFDEDIPDLLPFHDGAFKLALIANANVQPMLILDTRARFNSKKKFGAWPGVNRVLYLPIVKIENWHKDQDGELKKYAYAYMNACYNFALKNEITACETFANEWLQANPASAFLNNLKTPTS
jgi:1-acyl-sn-glycerol-3-phosphate acyltransferase